MSKPGAMEKIFQMKSLFIYQEFLNVIFFYEVHAAVLLIFMSDLGKELEARFQDFAEIGKLSHFKSPYEITPATEWIDVAAKLLSLEKPLFQTEIFH